MLPRFLSLLAIAPLVVSLDPGLADVISSNHNLACQNGCAGASSAQQLNTNGALGSAVRAPLSVFGGLILASGVLVAL